MINACSALLATCLANTPALPGLFSSDLSRRRSLRTTRPSGSCPAGRPISAPLRMRAAPRPGTCPRLAARAASLRTPGPHGPWPVYTSWRPEPRMRRTRIRSSRRRSAYGHGLPRHYGSPERAAHARGQPGPRRRMPTRGHVIQYDGDEAGSHPVVIPNGINK
jgi:hypothetical protein